MTVLTKAFTQWASRPEDERFKSLEELHAATTHHQTVAIESHGVDLRALTIGTAENGDPMLFSPSGNHAHFTHTGFEQLCKRIGAPAKYMKALSPELREANMNYGLRTCENGDNDSMLFAQNGVRRLRSVLSDSYQRIWNTDITSRLLRLTAEQPEWQPAPAAFDGSRGLYASDADMFAFLVDNDRRIFESGPAGGLSRGFFVSNSEVGLGSFTIETFLYEFICGNHRVWGARDLKTIRIRHVGNADDRAFNELSVELTKYAESSARDDEQVIQRARAHVLADTKDALLDRVFGLRIPGVTRKVLEQSYDVAVAHEHWYGNPHSTWGFTGGLTQVARDLPNASDRVQLERASSKILALSA